MVNKLNKPHVLSTCLCNTFDVLELTHNVHLQCYQVASYSNILYKNNIRQTINALHTQCLLWYKKLLTKKQ